MVCLGPSFPQSLAFQCVNIAAKDKGILPAKFAWLHSAPSLGSHLRCHFLQEAFQVFQWE